MGDDHVPEATAWGQLLSCYTQKALFWLESVMTRDYLLNVFGYIEHNNVSAWPKPELMPVPLRDLTGSDAGFLRLHTWAHVCTEGAQGFYELVAISQSYTLSPRGATSLHQRP
jgi:hypothetical protein